MTRTDLHAKLHKDLETETQLNKQRIAILSARIRRENDPVTQLLDTFDPGYRDTLKGLSLDQLKRTLRKVDFDLVTIEYDYQYVTGKRLSPIEEMSPFYPYANTQAEMELMLAAEDNKIKYVRNKLKGGSKKIKAPALEMINPEYMRIFDQYDQYDQASLERELENLQTAFAAMKEKYEAAADPYTVSKDSPFYPHADTRKEMEFIIELQRQRVAILTARVEHKEGPETELLDEADPEYGHTLDTIEREGLDILQDVLSGAKSHLQYLESFFQEKLRFKTERKAPIESADRR
jgi:hypothetical protein